MNKIENIIKTLELLGGSSTLEELTKTLCRSKHIIFDSYYKLIVQQVLNNNKSLVSYSNLTKKWSLKSVSTNENEYLYVSENRYFNTIRDAMLELFDMSVSSGGAYFKIKGTNDYAWFPKYDNANPSWTNTLSEDGRIWREKPNNLQATEVENNRHLEEHKRYAFEFVKNNGRMQYRFTGVFQQIRIDDDGTRVYEIVDDKLLIRREKYLLVCNVTYMKEYKGIIDNDKIVGGAGQYTSDNHDGGEKENFLPHDDGMTYGFVEAGYKDAEHTGDINYAKKIDINNFSKKFKNSDYADGVRVVFIAKGPNNDKHVVVGWYENARVYRSKQFIEGHFGYNITCKNDDAHLILEEERTFEYPKKNDDGSYNFGQSNVSYPFIFNQQTTLNLANRLNEYIDSLLIK